MRFLLLYLGIGISLVGCGGSSAPPGAEFYVLNDSGASSTSHAMDVANDGTAVGYIEQAGVLTPAQWFGSVARTRAQLKGQVTHISANGQVSVLKTDQNEYYMWRVGEDPVRMLGPNDPQRIHSVNGLNADGSRFVITRFWPPTGTIDTLTVGVYTPAWTLQNTLTMWFRAQLGTEAVGRVRSTNVIYGTDQFRSHRFEVGRGYQSFAGLGSVLNRVEAMSSNGQVFVGVSSNRAVRWQGSPQNPEDLGTLGNDTSSHAYGVSDDGKIIVGQSGNRGFYWNTTERMRDLRQLLIDNRIDVVNWQLVRANGISPNGQWIIGSGIDGNGKNRAFVTRFK